VETEILYFSFSISSLDTSLDKYSLSFLSLYVFIIVEIFSLVNLLLFVIFTHSLLASINNTELSTFEDFF